MYSKAQITSKWFRYLLSASNGRGHGIHSPFVYELVREIFNNDTDYYAYKLIETARKQLLSDTRTVVAEDFGAGSALKKKTRTTVKGIAGSALSDQKFCRLLFRLASFYKARNIIELGSSLGISTSYLASADEQSRVVTMEGSSAIAAVAKENFEKLKLGNITQITGDFDSSLPDIVSANSPSDLVFIDGNHRKEAVLRYFELFLARISSSSCIIIHDIHWSRGMEESWAAIQEHPAVKMSVDIFSAGLVFFRNEFQVKQNFTIRF